MKNNRLLKILSKPSVEAAPLILGWSLVRKLPEGFVKGRIVEVEAYNENDPASHSYRGISERTAPMFKAAGHIYVYFTYGTHYCINIVTGETGVGEAVLIRALEPTLGLEIMSKNRGTVNTFQLASGPGKLTQAFGIVSKNLSGRMLGKRTFWLEPPEAEITTSNIMTSPRIGIKKAVNQLWRFYLKDSPYVSKNTIRI